jgi:hypothetical protein
MSNDLQPLWGAFKGTLTPALSRMREREWLPFSGHRSGGLHGSLSPVPGGEGAMRGSNFLVIYAALRLIHS